MNRHFVREDKENGDSAPQGSSCALCLGRCRRTDQQRAHLLVQALDHIRIGLRSVLLGREAQAPVAALVLALPTDLLMLDERHFAVVAFPAEAGADWAVDALG